MKGPFARPDEMPGIGFLQLGVPRFHSRSDADFLIPLDRQFLILIFSPIQFVVPAAAYRSIATSSAPLEAVLTPIT